MLFFLCTFGLFGLVIRFCFSRIKLNISVPANFPTPNSHECGHDACTPHFYVYELLAQHLPPVPTPKRCVALSAAAENCARHRRKPRNVCSAAAEQAANRSVQHKCKPARMYISRAKKQRNERKKERKARECWRTGGWVAIWFQVYYACVKFIPKLLSYIVGLCDSLWSGHTTQTKTKSI